MTFLFVGLGYKSFLGNYGGMIYFLIGALIGFSTIWSIMLLLPHFIKRKYDLDYLKKFKKAGGIIIILFGGLIILNILRRIIFKF